jgi:hypothetical protein
MGVIVGALKQASKGEWLHDVGELYVQVLLSQADDAKVREQNKGLSQPIMLSNVIKKDSNKGFPNAVICDRGSNIQFMLKSRGPRGYGYHVESGKEVIVDSLYCIDMSDKPGQNPAVCHLQCYATSARWGHNIKVDDWATLGVAQDLGLAEQYWSCRIYTWPLYGFVKDGKAYGTPRGPAEADVKGAGVHAGDQMESGIRPIERMNEPADRQGSNNGYVTLYFFVFSDLEKKKAFYETQELGDAGDFA